MSAIARVLSHLMTERAVLAPLPRGGFGVLPGGDRRRRPVARATAQQVRDLEADGAITIAEDGAFVLTEAGKARARRAGAAQGEAYLAQHHNITPRTVIDTDGGFTCVRGMETSPVMRRMRALKDASGAPWLSDSELRAAGDLRRHWEEAQAGLVRGSNWTAAPMGSSPRGPSSAQEHALAARCDARRKLAEALDGLAPALRRIVERVCLHEDGIEALERAEGWPARSGKVALKLGLAQLAAARASC